MNIHGTDVLPIEVWGYIFRFVDPLDISTLNCVCKEFSRLIEVEDAVWTGIFAHRFPWHQLPPASSARSIIQRSAALQRHFVAPPNHISILATHLAGFIPDGPVVSMWRQSDSAELAITDDTDSYAVDLPDDNGLPSGFDLPMDVRYDTCAQLTTITFQNPHTNAYWSPYATAVFTSSYSAKHHSLELDAYAATSTHELKRGQPNGLWSALNSDCSLVVQFRYDHDCELECFSAADMSEPDATYKFERTSVCAIHGRDVVLGTLHRLQLLDYTTGVIAVDFRSPDLEYGQTVTSLFTSGNLLVSGHVKASLVAFDMRSGQQVAHHRAKKRGASSFERVLGTDRTLDVFSSSGSVQVFDLRTHRCVTTTQQLPVYSDVQTVEVDWPSSRAAVLDTNYVLTILSA
eukprot:TRINITY_DN3814_c0_g1_i6.p1 TRINITY_DN3814_c0_g1~~TRINITY_DN3814_c0_g1_i6.p1  ORF type:complete len:403 (-),score=64.59 TRINITY_DN3814_c0_g1_i6:393-1601(-)